MTKEEFRRRLMATASTEQWVTNTIEAIVRVMMALKISDPNFLMQMPATTFDELATEMMSIRRKDKAAYEESLQKRRQPFGR